MSKGALSRLDQTVRSFSVVPTVLFLFLLNGILACILVWWHWSSLVGLREAALGEMEYRLESAANRLRVIASLPGTEACLTAADRTQRSSLQRRQAIEETSRLWLDLSRDDLRVREVLDNNVAEMFVHLCGRDPWLWRLVLTDGMGVQIAASEKIPGYNCRDENWRTMACSNAPGVVVSEGPSKDGCLILATRLVLSRGNESPEGVLREDLRVEPLLTGLAAKRTNEDSTALVVGWAPRPMAGSPALPESVTSVIEAAAGLRGPINGWRHGVRFSAEAVDAGIAWTRPPWVIATRSEAFIPLVVAVPITLSILVSILIAMAWDRKARRTFRDSNVNRYMDLLEAGDWILRTAINRPSVLVPLSGDGKGRGKAIMPEPSPVQRELQAWLHRLLQDLHDEYTSHTYEMQQDLNLARDFQRAYIDRTYPKVPPVHAAGELRLVFYHRYEPALALGGDFFDIAILNEKCAGVFIADVMGHGTRSALITAILRTLIDDLAPYGKDVRRFLSEMNRQFCGLLKNMPHPLFTSAVYFVADLIAHVGTFSSAGHPAPFLVRRSEGLIRRLEVPSPRGAALGLIPNESYTGGLYRMLDGDAFIFFTDGIYEARNVHGEEYGIARMEKVVRESMHKTGKEIVDAIMEDASNFLSYEPVSDDICIVAMDVTTQPEG